MLEDVVWVVVPIVAMAGMLWLAARIEPHWVAKDGRRFLTTGEVVDGRGERLGRRREMRVVVADDDRLLLSRRSLMRTRSEEMTLATKSPHPPRRKEIYLLDSIPPDADGTKMVLRLPASSAAVPVLDDILSRRGSGPAARRPDRG